MAPPTAKRPRTPTKGAPEPTTKKKKTSKKKDKQKKGGGNTNVSFTAPPASKQPPPPTVTNTAPKQSAAVTTTASPTPTETAPPDDTLIMAQMIATFSHFEQSRFSAFTRASLSTEVVQDWVSTVVRHRCNTTTASTVLPDHEDISLVVSMAAKSYAQRLLAAAAATAAATTVDGSSDTDAAAITFDTVLEAAERMPPRFYAQGTTVSPVSSSTSSEWEQKRLAALEAQEAYDEEHGTAMEEDGETIEN